jgi:hypothetical protein
MKCPECGEIILKGQALCPNCHFNLAVPVEENPSEQPAQGQATPANDDKAPKPHKSNAMAWVLSILAAIIIIGVVVFYVNKNNQDCDGRRGIRTELERCDRYSGLQTVLGRSIRIVNIVKMFKTD